MKVYIVASMRADQHTKDNLLEVSRYLESKGHTVNKHRLIEKFESKPQYNETELSDYHKKMMNSIRQCDVMIVDITAKSSGLGYEVAVALNERKPILALYSGIAQEGSSLSLKSNPSKLIHVKKYTEDSLKPTVDEFMSQAKDQVDTKFILILSSEIDNYLEWVATERRMHKAQIVRTAIESMMQKDKKYKDFLRSI